MKILVTGSDGFLGSVLVDRLLQDGHEVVGFDAQFFGLNGRLDYERILGRVEEAHWPSLLRQHGIELVFALAAVSNDPAGDLDPIWTKRVNHWSVVALAHACRAQGVWLAFPSSASVYGAVNYPAAVGSPLFPQTVYACSKAEAERDLMLLADDDWCPHIARLATLYGYSPRMRFDLAINKMILDARARGYITVDGDGRQMRPFLAVAQAAEHFARLADEPGWGAVENVVSFNTSIRDLALDVAGILGGGVEVELGGGSPDRRNYRMYSPFLYPFDVQYVREVDDFVLTNDHLDAAVYYTVRRLGEVLA